MAHEPDGPVIEVGGVGLLVRVSATTGAALPSVGGEAVLSTVLVVREESLDLYGFASPGERLLFEAFTSVSGVGPRLAGAESRSAWGSAAEAGQRSVLSRRLAVGKSFVMPHLRRLS